MRGIIYIYFHTQTKLKLMMKKYLAILCLLFAEQALSQDLPTARKTIEQLSAKEMWGQGYTRNGLEKAAKFITSAFKSYGLKPMDGKDYRQPFTLPINTFPGKMSATVNSKTLKPGRDFIVVAESTGKNQKGSLRQVDSVTFIDAENSLVCFRCAFVSTRVSSGCWFGSNRTNAPDDTEQYLR
ncbi:hypothetical protein [Pedobacter frigoris]|uniref:Uncharacterized protein n=1 Tax=Pedobacter frigoris TaxID=2571272 RepID=A0A4U1CDJ4_9SPHI|nr:hypothetical protein [Pedobacter frigoris]TKC05038.1 hypothetical protein FA047_14820 [Pedobacter frigoris]